MSTVDLDILELFGETVVIGQQPMELLSAVREGLPYAALPALADALGVEVEAVADLIALSERTRQRRKGGALTPAESDRLVRLARVAAHAVRVFGGREAARAWLERDNAALGGRPLALLDTDLGATEVDAVLVRIEHGVFG